MVLFYRSFIESVLTFCFISFYGNLSVKNKNCLLKIVRDANKIIGMQQLSLSEIFDRRVLQEARSILSSLDHPLSEEFILLPEIQATEGTYK